MTGEERLAEGIVSEDVEESDRQVKEEALEESGKKNKALEVTFVFPRCKFLVDARATYGDRHQGNRVCRRVCRLMIEEMTGRLTNHSWDVKPNLATKRCTFTITTKPWNPEVIPRDAEEGPASSRGDAGGCGCDDKSLEW